MMITNTNGKPHIATMFLDIWHLYWHKHFSTHTRTRAVPPVPKRVSCGEMAWVWTPEEVGRPSRPHLHSQARFSLCVCVLDLCLSCTCVVLFVVRIKARVFGNENSELLWWKLLALHAAKSCVHWQPTVILRELCLPRAVLETRTSHSKPVSRLHLSWSRGEKVPIATNCLGRVLGRIEIGCGVLDDGDSSEQIHRSAVGRNLQVARFTPLRFHVLSSCGPHSYSKLSNRTLWTSSTPP